jgi:hypothetical protein
MDPTSSTSTLQPNPSTVNHTNPTPTATITASTAQSPLDTFFARYKTFTLADSKDPEFSLITEFSRLAIHKKWSSNSRNYLRARRAFREAMIEEFNIVFGINERDLSSWQRLCLVVWVSLEKIPTSITQCRKVFSPYFLSVA